MKSPQLGNAYPRIPGYVDTATYGLPARATVAALHRAADDWAVAATAPRELDRSVERMRAAFAAIAGSQPEHVAIGGSVSQFVGTVAASLPDGARVLAIGGDFASVLYPFLADPRLEVTLVGADELLDAVRPGIDLVAVSAVQSCDGRTIDLGALAVAARAAGARTLVDVSHAAGWLPMRALDFDVVVAAGYKWLATPRGLAFAAVNPKATWLRPVCASWYGADDPWGSLYGPELRLSDSARRFDTSPPWQLVEAGAIALETLAALDRTAVREHSVGLANLFRSRLGLPEGDSPIVAVAAVAPEALVRAGIRATARNGKARFSFYVYNDVRDVEMAASVASRLVMAG